MESQSIKEDSPIFKSIILRINILYYRKEAILKELKDELPTYFMSLCNISERLTLIDCFNDASLHSFICQFHLSINMNPPVAIITHF